MKWPKDIKGIYLLWALRSHSLVGLGGYGLIFFLGRLMTIIFSGANSSLR